jgi:uncharacterized repeat protein (TIGR02543 family)
MGQRRPPRRRVFWKPDRKKLLIALVLAAVLLLAGLVALGGDAYAQTVTFTADSLLGKPTNNSITVNIVPAAAIQYYYEYGTTDGGPYPGQSSTVDATGGQPSELTITGLSANTKYYYRLVYDGDGSVTDGDVERGTQHSFHTARPAGSTFSFSVTSDGHAQNTQSAFTNILTELPDFNVDLGDTFMVDSATTQSAVNTAYLNVRGSSRMGLAGVSVPMFSTPGNHEQEEGWNLDEANGIGSIQARKAFIPTPSPLDAPFYSANSDPLSAIDDGTYGNDYREDYFAWTWGDALFIVIDTFEYTSQLPYQNSVAGEGANGQNDPVGGDLWNWTLGKTQYDWLTNVLETSTAKYKFVFSHQMLGGILPSDAGLPSPDYVGYVRGGAQGAPYYEWGGYSANNVGAYDFATKRPNFAKPVRQLFMETGVTAYFHGHDHQYVYETRDDGMAYVEVPSCGTMTGFSVYPAAPATYDDVGGGFDEVAKSNSQGGHVRITVAPSQATLELISSGGSVSDTRTMLPHVSGPTNDLTMAVSPGGSGTTNPAVGTHPYAEDTVVNITATPAAGYVFDHWTGDVTNPNSASTTVTMDADQTVTAYFTAQNYNLTMAVSPSGGGTTTPPVGTSSQGANSVVNITATPATGYVFSSWTGPGVANPNSPSTTVTMDATKTVTANFTAVPPGTVVLDGAVSRGTADDVSSLSFSHTIGTNTNRLLVVGVAWNSNADARSISSVTFTPSGGSAQNLTLAISRTHSTQNRYSALYYLVNPGSGVTGSVAVTFSGTVTAGIVAGAANFAGVDQVSPIGVTGYADSGSAQNTTPSVTLNGLTGNELVIDNLFMGGTSSSQTITVGSGQTERWNDFAGNARAGGSTEQAGSTSVTMSWTAATNAYWDVVAAAIKPATGTSTYDLNLAVGWNLIAATPGVTFPSQLFAWNGSSYQSATSATAWQGYWIKAASASSLTVTGATGPHTVNLTTGWNLIGNSMNTTATLTLPAGVQAFVYNTGTGSYASTLTLQPGQGAWVKGTSGQNVVLTGS